MNKPVLSHKAIPFQFPLKRVILVSVMRCIKTIRINKPVDVFRLPLHSVYLFISYLDF
ncbi:hypothetical protein HMPREF1210_01035 [Paenisporosarcina sp. HGH0030]|nr:hypothetical protein HMPREF1210_01035 [Paenisporosarcina sp. HGH0030]